jgi:hypothetical protein
MLFRGLLGHDGSDLLGVILSIPPYPDRGHTKLFLPEAIGVNYQSTGHVCPYVKRQNCHPDSRFLDQILAIEGSHWNLLPHRAVILIPRVTPTSLHNSRENDPEASRGA